MQAVLLAVHGFNDYSTAFDDPAEDWTAAGLLVYAYDQRGFGDTENRGIWAGTATLAADLTAVTAALQRRHPELPLYIVGESMGGAVALAALGSDDPPQTDGAVLVAPAAWSLERLPSLERQVLAFCRGIPALAFPFRCIGRSDADGQFRRSRRALPRSSGDQADPGRRRLRPVPADGRCFGSGGAGAGTASGHVRRQ